MIGIHNVIDMVLPFWFVMFKNLQRLCEILPIIKEDFTMPSFCEEFKAANIYSCLMDALVTTFRILFMVVIVHGIFNGELLG